MLQQWYVKLHLNSDIFFRKSLISNYLKVSINQPSLKTAGPDRQMISYIFPNKII